jgi:hypothetical protein
VRLFRVAAVLERPRPPLTFIVLPGYPRVRFLPCPGGDVAMRVLEAFATHAGDRPSEDGAVR